MVFWIPLAHVYVLNFFNDYDEDDVDYVYTNVSIRYGYDVVKSRQIEYSKMRFITHPNWEVLSVDTTHLSLLPESLNLNSIFQFKPQFRTNAYSSFVDYKSFFENSLIFHDDVLGPFLAKLKDHIMSVQVCLGKIDEWLMVPNNTIQFLQSTFDAKLEFPRENEVLEGDCKCAPRMHSDNDVCLFCK